MFFLHIKSSPNLLFGVLCLPGDQSHPFAQTTINPLACCNCSDGLLGRAVFPPWNEGPNSGSYTMSCVICHHIHSGHQPLDSKLLYTSTYSISSLGSLIGNQIYIWNRTLHIFPLISTPHNCFISIFRCSILIGLLAYILHAAIQYQHRSQEVLWKQRSDHIIHLRKSL